MNSDLFREVRILIDRFKLTIKKEGSKLVIKLPVQEFPEKQAERLLEDFFRIISETSRPLELSASFTKSKLDSTIFNVIQKWNSENRNKIKIYKKDLKYKIQSEDQALLFGLVLSILQFIYGELL